MKNLLISLLHTNTTQKCNRGECKLQAGGRWVGTAFEIPEHIFTVWKDRIN